MGSGFWEMIFVLGSSVAITRAGINMIAKVVGTVVLVTNIKSSPKSHLLMFRPLFSGCFYFLCFLSISNG